MDIDDISNVLTKSYNDKNCTLNIVQHLNDLKIWSKLLLNFKIKESQYWSNLNEIDIYHWTIIEYEKSKYVEFILKMATILDVFTDQQFLVYKMIKNGLIWMKLTANSIDYYWLWEF